MFSDKSLANRHRNTKFAKVSSHKETGYMHSIIEKDPAIYMQQALLAIMRAKFRTVTKLNMNT